MWVDRDVTSSSNSLILPLLAGRKVVHGHDIELWQGDHNIERFKVAAE
jgi:hypothetical protein